LQVFLQGTPGLQLTSGLNRRQGAIGRLFPGDFFAILTFENKIDGASRLASSVSVFLTDEYKKGRAIKASAARSSRANMDIVLVRRDTGNTGFR